MEQGLAEQLAGPQQMGGDMQAMVDQVVQMLMQGVDPQQLVEQGVPMEVVAMAVEIVLAQEQQMGNMQQAPQTEAGLAMTMV